jgi:hypothetical protein
MIRHSPGGVMVRRLAGNGFGMNARHIYLIRIIRRGEGAMKSFVMFLAIATAGASFLFFTAAKEVQNANWAYKACREANWFCHNPQVLAFVAVGLIVLWALATLLSAIRD